MPNRPRPPIPRRTLPNVRLAEALMFAFGMSSYDQIVGPDWIQSPDALFDIVGKAPPSTPRDKIRVMTLNLLMDRFKLKLHHARREILNYALVVDKKGSKLKEADGGGNQACALAQDIS